MPKFPDDYYWTITGDGYELVAVLKETDLTDDLEIAVGSTIGFDTTGYEMYFRLATYSNGTFIMPNDKEMTNGVKTGNCIYNDVNYVMVYRTNPNQYLQLALNNDGKTPRLINDRPAFILTDLSQETPLTYFTLLNPREYKYNVFLITMTGIKEFFTVNMWFYEHDKNGTYSVHFDCSRCGCGDEQVYRCCSSGCAPDTLTDNCFYTECLSGKCGGICSGACSNGGECIQNEAGSWECRADCTNKPCGGACYGACSNPGEVCNEVQNGVYQCVDPCATGACGGQCPGTCPTGRACINVNGTYECQTVCNGECGGDCEGTCPSGQECLEGTDGKWYCLENVPEPPTKVPVYKLWWFWVILIVGIIILAVIGYLFYRHEKKKKTATQPKPCPTQTPPAQTPPTQTPPTQTPPAQTPPAQPTPVKPPPP